MKQECNNLEQLPQVALNIINAHRKSRVFALYGSMGAGKTTVTKAFCDILHVVDVVNSPTFAIINEYITDDGDSVFHFDCYRLKDKKEFFDIGGEDYFYSGSYCFVEWPQLIEEHLPADCVKITITVDDNGTRIFYDDIKS